MSLELGQAICYDLNTVSQFFYSCAQAVAMERHTHLIWQRDNSSAFMNFFSIGDPGTFEIVHSSNVPIEQMTKLLHEHYIEIWLRKIFESGPSVGEKYVSDLWEIRESCRNFVMQLYREAELGNREVRTMIGGKICYLSSIKLAGSVGVATLGALAFFICPPAGAVIATGIDIGYGISLSITENWERGRDATVVAIEDSVGTDMAEEIIQGGIEKGKNKALEKNKEESMKAIEYAKHEIRKYSQRLSGKGGFRTKAKKQARKIISEAEKIIEEQQLVLIQGGRAVKIGGLVCRALPVIFAANDIIGYYSQYAKEVNEATR
jgi:vacuolar-type H+-ATPase subunit H